MKTLLTSPEFRAELPGWALRGVFCALPSGFLAITGSFGSAREITGMVVGLVVWVMIFASRCAWLQRYADWDETPRVTALKRAAWIKVGLSALGLLGCEAEVAGFRALALLQVLVFVDVVPGVMAVGMVSAVAATKAGLDVADTNSFGWTALITIAEGFLIALMIAVLACLVGGCTPNSRRSAKALAD
ncbi:MAG: hypothetical protein JSS11_01410 [Verrucomicrobia bacterium]|nr:hypothetical protein [Verrucomicrobiota bacterium]